MTSYCCMTLSMLHEPRKHVLDIASLWPWSDGCHLCCLWPWSGGCHLVHSRRIELLVLLRASSERESRRIMVHRTTAMYCDTLQNTSGKNVAFAWLIPCMHAQEEKVYVLSCSHFFHVHVHVKCIWDAIVKTSPRCPLCLKDAHPPLLSSSRGLNVEQWHRRR